MKKSLIDYMKTAMLVAFAVLAAFTVQACSDDDEGDSIPVGFCGTYCNNHQNRVYRYYTFYKDGTGEYRMESNVSIHQGYFTYKFKGDKVTCKGYKAGAWDDGSVDEGNIDVTFTYKITTNFMLVTKDGEVFEKIY